MFCKKSRLLLLVLVLGLSCATHVDARYSPSCPKMEEGHTWATLSAPWYLTDQSEPRSVETSIANGSCSIRLDGTVLSDVDIEYLEDDTGCHGFRIHGIEQPGHYQFICDEETTIEDVDVGEFHFEVGKEVVIDDSFVDDLDITKAVLACENGEDGCEYEGAFFEPEGLSDGFFDFGGLVLAYVASEGWGGTTYTQEREHWAAYENSCKDYRLEVQAIAYDGSDAGSASADIVCQELFDFEDSGCSTTPRSASAAAVVMALLGLGMRRRRRKFDT